MNTYNTYSGPNSVTPVVKIKVIGVGGGGGNAIDRMVNAGVSGVEFIAVNTDKQALQISKADYRIQIGIKLTRGWGAGADPLVGLHAAEENQAELDQTLNDADLVFITAGMGGGTGTGAAPLIANLAKEKEILTIAVVTKPFNFEGRKRMENAENGIEALRKVVDSLVIIPNEKLFKLVPKGTSIVDTFRYADDVLRQGVQGISNLIVQNSLINLDFADVRTIMKNRGHAHMGIGRAKGDRKIFEALSQAVNSPLLETSIEGATGIIFNVKGGMDLPLDQVYEAADLMRDLVDPSCNIIFGASVDDTLEDAVEITVIATGFASNSLIDKKDGVNPVEETAKEYSQKKYAEFLANRISSGNVSKTTYDEEELELASGAEVGADKDVAKADSGSRFVVDDADIPPFLRKIRKEKKGR